MNDASQGQGYGQSGLLSGMQSPQFMLGMTLLSASRAKNPEAALAQGMAQYQQMLQQQQQQQYQNAQLAIQQRQLGLSENSDARAQSAEARAAEEVQRTLQQGTNMAKNTIGENPSRANGWQGSGYIGANASVRDNPAMAALFNPEAPTGTPFDIQEKFVSNKLDPVTMMKLNASKDMALAGQLPQAANALPQYPAPFTLSPGQQQFSPDGNLIAQNVDTSKIDTSTDKLRTEFINQSKPYVEILNSYGRIQAVADKPSAAGDLALIFNYMKMLDPGSAVREQEFANAQNAAGIPERVRAMYNNTLRGERLTESTRADFLGQANNLYGAALKNHEQLSNYYTGLATDTGVNPSRVIVDYRGKDSDAPKGSVDSPSVPQFTDLQFQNLDKELGLPSGKSKEMYMQKVNGGGR